MTNEEKALKSDLIKLMQHHGVALIGYEDLDGQNSEYYFEGDNITLNLEELLE